MVAAANAALARREPEAAAVTIGYFSGTASHDADFLQAATAVLDVLAAFPQARLLVVGPLELDERFVGLSSRIERLERRPFDELPELIRLADVALAPLEPGTGSPRRRARLSTSRPVSSGSRSSRAGRRSSPA